MKDEEHDDLWELLGKAPRPMARPRFVQDVLRRVRMEEAPRPEPGFIAWLKQGWNGLAVAGLAVCLLLIVSANQSGPSGEARLAELNASADATISSTDLAAISNLDVLLALDDRNPWLENSRY